MKKILLFSVPFINHIPADASRLGILHAHNQILPIIHNFMNVFAFNISTNDNNYVLDTQFFWNIPEIERKLIPKVLIEDIIGLIWNALENEYYINICFDSCKISAYRFYDVDKVFPHQMCIYGMDTAKRICYCADFFSESGYKNVAIPIDDIKRANSSLQNETLCLDPQTGTTDWVTDVELLKPLIHYNQSLNLELICKNMCYFLNGENTSGIASYTRVRPHVMTSRKQEKGKWLYEANVLFECYGINVFEQVKEYLINSLESSKYTINHKMFYIIYAFQKLMVFRLNYINQKINDSELLSLEDKYKLLLSDAQVILNTGIKLSITDKESLKVKLIALINTHIINTKKILTEVLDVLKSHVL